MLLLADDVLPFHDETQPLIRTCIFITQLLERSLLRASIPTVVRGRRGR
eukprot:COSAG06_NODE_5789_length_3273_cov_3.080970_2_plen_49_part_00